MRTLLILILFLNAINLNSQVSKNKIIQINNKYSRQVKCNVLLNNAFGLGNKVSLKDSSLRFVHILTLKDKEKLVDSEIERKGLKRVSLNRWATFIIKDNQYKAVCFDRKITTDSVFYDIYYDFIQLLIVSYDELIIMNNFHTPLYLYCASSKGIVKVFYEWSENGKILIP
ncbi:MAG: hypothetical protein IPM71_14315 [Bacteroidota bacterium]|nr:MAG: hypothetical protein IPM71_14315 [Bacteroidota bacterium]